MPDEDLHEELRRGVEWDYDLAFDAHARAMKELRVSEQDLEVALTLPHRDPIRQTIVVRWYQARAVEHLAGEVLERCGQTLEALPHTAGESR
ncbi:hypothetical protein [Kineococcus sp. SYSU DK003]|uniref:hypothetical protein n=1 Tax=Kineococcus sp. SYSU DK003 TaxID=3383124 RepID=UPI003D7D1E6C